MDDPLSRFTPEQLARAREELKADEVLYRSFLDAGMTGAQANEEMAKRGHEARYLGLLARRVAPAARKEPIDTDIEKRRKTAGDPPAGAINNPTPRAGKPEKVDSMDDGKPVDPASMQWFLAYEKDPQTGLAKWPLSFKRIEKDVKRPGKPPSPNAAHPRDQKPEQPPTCV